MTIIIVVVIPRGCIEYEMMDSQQGFKHQVGYNHLISNKYEWKCQDILPDLADFVLQEQSKKTIQ